MILDEPRDPEVAELDELTDRLGLELDARAHEHHVVGLDVAMDDAEPVRLRERTTRIRDESERANRSGSFVSLRSAAATRCRPRRARAPQIVQPAILVEVDVVRDVRAADLGEHARFLAEPPQQLRIGRDLGLEQLDRDVGATRLIARLPDLAHGAHPELARELEAPDLQPHARPRRPCDLHLAQRRPRDDRPGADQPAHEIVRGRPRIRIDRRGPVDQRAHAARRLAPHVRCEQLEQRADRVDIGGGIGGRAGGDLGRHTARDPVMCERSRRQPGELDPRPIARADVHRPRMQPAVRDPDVMRRRHRACELAEDLHRAIEPARRLLDQLGERRPALAFEQDLRRARLEREHVTDRHLIKRADHAQPSIEPGPPRRRRTEAELDELDQLIAAACEHGRAIGPRTELRERRQLVHAVRRGEQRRHGLVDRLPHRVSLREKPGRRPIRVSARSASR